MRSIFLLIFIGCALVSQAKLHAQKVVLITCATGALGSDMAKVLIKEYDLIITGRNQQKLEALQKELVALSGNKVTACLVDYSNRDSIAKCIQEIKPEALWGCVLFTPRPGTGLQASQGEWQEMLQSCFIGPQDILKIFVEKAPGKAKALVIAGTTSVEVAPEYGAASVLRSMWVAHAKVLSHIYGPKNISINCLSPGVVLTDHHKRRIQNKAVELGRTYDEQYALEALSTPLKKFASPQEVANCARFLLSEESDHINGVNLVLDGGMTRAY